MRRPEGWCSAAARTRKLRFSFAVLSLPLSTSCPASKVHFQNGLPDGMGDFLASRLWYESASRRFPTRLPDGWIF
jgi:hypothetical protein